MNIRRKVLHSFLAVFMSTLMLTPSIMPAFGLSYTGSSSYESGDYYTALEDVDLDGNARKDIVKVAKSQKGYHEGKEETDLSGDSTGKKNYTEYGRWYGMNGAEWCAMFVSWCAAQAEVDTDVVPKHSYTEDGLQWFKKRDQAYTRKQVFNGTYSPQKGDIIYFLSEEGKLKGRNTNHVGIVTGFSASKKEIYTIEGNSNNQVATRTYLTSDTYIVYVCSPKYETESNGSSSSNSSVKYFAKCSSSCNTITKGLNNIGVDSSYAYRKQIAAANNISNYSGTASQNNQMLDLLKQGKLIKPSGSTNTTPTVKYFPKCSSSCNTITKGLNNIGVDSSYAYRKQIAAANNISNYSGTASQNNQMLDLLKQGKLIKP